MTALEIKVKEFMAFEEWLSRKPFSDHWYEYWANTFIAQPPEFRKKMIAELGGWLPDPDPDEDMGY